ncbi:TetR family transcriptional regulator [Actinomyces oricola]
MPSRHRSTTPPKNESAPGAPQENPARADSADIPGQENTTTPASRDAQTPGPEKTFTPGQESLPAGDATTRQSGATPQLPDAIVPPNGRTSTPPPGSRSPRAVAPPDGRTRYANGERRRTEIVEAAMKAFAELGYNNLSLRQIAQAVGVSHTLLRHHFGSKEVLLQAVLAHREKVETQWRNQLIAKHGLLDALPQIMEHNTTIPGLIQLDAVLRAEAVNPEHPAHDYVVGLAQRFRSTVRQDLAGEQQTGRLREGIDIDLVTVQLTSLIEGVQSEWLLDRRIDMVAVVRDLAQQLRRR